MSGLGVEAITSSASWLLVKDCVEKLGKYMMVSILSEARYHLR